MEKGARSYLGLVFGAGEDKSAQARTKLVRA